MPTVVAALIRYTWSPGIVITPEVAASVTFVLFGNADIVPVAVVPSIFSMTITSFAASPFVLVRLIVVPAAFEFPITYGVVPVLNDKTLAALSLLPTAVTTRTLLDALDGNMTVAAEVPDAFLLTYVGGSAKHAVTAIAIANPENNLVFIVFEI